MNSQRVRWRRKKVTINDAAELLRAKNNIIILTHIRPDGDTMGSASALCYALRQIGKTAYLFNNPQFEDNDPWIAEPYLAPADFKPDFTVAVDMADTTLFPNGFKGSVDFCVDHHPSNTGYAKQTIVWPTKASCGEIVLELCKALMGKLDPTVADLLYIAVSTDTGCFVYGNTTGETLAAGAELCQAGARNAALNKILFRTSSKARIKLEALLMSDFRYYRDGRIVISVVSKELLQKAGAVEKDCQDIAALPGRVKGGVASAVIKEIDATHCKISVRTTGLVDANLVCSRFGGGGHKMASGCMMEKNCFEAADILAETIGEQLK